MNGSLMEEVLRRTDGGRDLNEELRKIVSAFVGGDARLDTILRDLNADMRAAGLRMVLRGMADDVCLDIAAEMEKLEEQHSASNAAEHPWQAHLEKTFDMPGLYRHTQHHALQRDVVACIDSCASTDCQDPHCTVARCKRHRTLREVARDHSGDLCKNSGCMLYQYAAQDAERVERGRAYMCEMRKTQDLETASSCQCEQRSLDSISSDAQYLVEGTDVANSIRDPCPSLICQSLSHMMYREIDDTLLRLHAQEDRSDEAIGVALHDSTLPAAARLRIVASVVQRCLKIYHAFHCKGAGCDSLECHMLRQRLHGLYCHAVPTLFGDGFDASSACDTPECSTCRELRAYELFRDKGTRLLRNYHSQRIAEAPFPDEDWNGTMLDFHPDVFDMECSETPCIDVDVFFSADA